MATRPPKHFIQRVKEKHRQNSCQAYQQYNQDRVYFYRKGRIPTMDDQMQKPGYIWSVPSAGGHSLKYSNDSHRIQALKSQLRRELTLMHKQLNEQKFFRKLEHISIKQITQTNIPHRKVTTEPSPQRKIVEVPLCLRKQSNYINKMRTAIYNSADKDIAEIEAKMAARSETQTKKHRLMLDGLKGRCFYSMMRKIEIPNSFQDC